MPEYIENVILLNPIKKVISKKLFNETFGKDFEFSFSCNNKKQVAAKIALLSVYKELERNIPSICNLRDLLMADYSFSDKEINKFCNIYHISDLKVKYFDDLLNNLEELKKEYSFIKSKTHTKLSLDQLESFERLIKRYRNCCKDCEEVNDKKINRVKRINVYFSEEEFNYIKSKSTGPLSSFIRNIIFDHLENRDNG